MFFSILVMTAQALLASFVLIQEGVPLCHFIIPTIVTGGALVAYHHVCVSSQVRTSRPNCSIDVSWIKAVEDALDRDSLTGVLNRRAIVHKASAMQNAWCGGGLRWFVAVADIDFFKSINDEHGHRVGDTVLQCIATLFRARMGSDEFVARYGGEEFCFILQGTCILSIIGRIEDLRRGVEEHICGMIPELVSAVTVSIGISEWQIDHSGFEQAVDDADLALYSAKASGRNCIRCYPVDNREPQDQLDSEERVVALTRDDMLR